MAPIITIGSLVLSSLRSLRVPSSSAGTLSGVVHGGAWKEASPPQVLRRLPTATAGIPRAAFALPQARGPVRISHANRDGPVTFTPHAAMTGFESPPRVHEREEAKEDERKRVQLLERRYQRFSKLLTARGVHGEMETGTNLAAELMAVVFSLDPTNPVETQFYPMTTSPIAEHVKMASSPLDESAAQATIPAIMTDSRHLLEQCQKLLYSVYYSEMGWRPSSKAHTKFDIKKDEQLFCDRYDETAIWTAIIDPRRPQKVVACTRLLSAASRVAKTNDQTPDLDILGYSGCPASFLDYVQAKGSARVYEGQRFAIAEEYRQMGLPYHLFHVGSMVPRAHDPEAVIVASASGRMTKYWETAGGTHDRETNWAISYEENDPVGSLPIFVVEAASMPSLIAAFFRAQREKQQRWIGGNVAP